MLMFNYRVIIAIIQKELLLLKRHRIQFFYEFLLPIIKMLPTILLGTYLLKTNGEATVEKFLGTNQVVLYISIGILFTIFIDIQEQVGYFLENEMWMGTLEQLWLTPTNKLGLIIGWIIFASVKAIVYGILSFLAVMIFSFNSIRVFSEINVIQLIVMFLILILISVINGLFISEISLRFRQSDSIIFFITMMIPVLSGISYPISVLPNFLRWISYLLPTTYAYDLLRNAILHTNTIFPLFIELFVLTVLILIQIFAAIKFFNKLVQRLEKCGTIYLK